MTFLTLAALIAELALIVGFVLLLHWATYRPAVGEYEGEIGIDPRCSSCCSWYWWQGRWRPSCGQLFRVERDRSGRLVSVPADR